MIEAPENSFPVRSPRPEGHGPGKLPRSLFFLRDPRFNFDKPFVRIADFGHVVHRTLSRY
jgi:hypothetical protein